MKTKFADDFNSKDPWHRYQNLPGRIFLDSNVLQYLQDFSEYVFDNYREDKDYFISPKRKIIKKGTRLYEQIIALHDIFINIERANFEFVVSNAVYDEVIKKKINGHHDENFIKWFYDVWDHWQAVRISYKNSISKEAFIRYEKAKKDKSLLGSLSRRDRNIILDAIERDCDAVLTVDKFADTNKQYFVYKKYKLMILKPTDFLIILKPFQSLYM